MDVSTCSDWQSSMWLATVRWPMGIHMDKPLHVSDFLCMNKRRHCWVLMTDPIWPCNLHLRPLSIVAISEAYKQWSLQGHNFAVYDPGLCVLMINFEPQGKISHEILKAVGCDTSFVQGEHIQYALKRQKILFFFLFFLSDSNAHFQMEFILCQHLWIIIRVLVEY